MPIDWSQYTEEPPEVDWSQFSEEPPTQTPAPRLLTRVPKVGVPQEFQAPEGEIPAEAYDIPAPGMVPGYLTKQFSEDIQAPEPEHAIPALGKVAKYANIPGRLGGKFLAPGLKPEESAIGISPENLPAPEAFDIPAPGMIPGAIARPIAEVATGLGQYLTSPQGIAESVAAATPLAPAVAAKWLLDMTVGATDSAKSAAEALAKGDKKEALRQSIHAAAMGFGMGHLGRGPAARGEAIIKRAADIAEQATPGGSRVALGRAAEQAKTIQPPTETPTTGESNAIQPESPQVLRTVQTQPGEGAREVPAAEGGGETGARGGEEGQAVRQVSLTAQDVSKMTPEEYFEDAQRRSKATMEGKGDGTSVQTRAEQAALANPDVAEWTRMRDEAAAEAQKVRDEVKADPKSMMRRQNEIMGAAQKVGFFNEGLDVLEGRKAALPVEELAPAAPSEFGGGSKTPQPERQILRDALKRIGDNPDSQHSEIAKKFLKLGDEAGLNVTVLSAPALKGKKVGGVYSPREDIISLHPERLSDDQTIVHEAAHALTSKKLAEEITGTYGIENLHKSALEGYLENGKNPHVKELIKLYNEVRSLPESKGHYGAMDFQEFLAEMFSNGTFQKLLSGIKKGGEKSLWQRFVSAVRNLLGFEPKDESALGKAMLHAEELIKSDRPEGAIATGAEPAIPFGISSPGKAWKDLKKSGAQSAKEIGPAAKELSDHIAKIGDDVLSLKKVGDQRKAILDWSGKMQISFDEARKLQKRIQSEVPDEVKREGITNWIQAGGDKTVLRDRASKSSGDLREGYEAALKLTPDELRVANEIKNTFDTLAARGQHFDVLNNFKDNYVTQIWNRVRKATGTSGRALKSNLRFNLASSFGSYFEGEQAGLTPKTKDIAKIIPMYLHEMNDVIAARQLIQDFSKGKASDGRPLVSPRGSETVVDGPKGKAVLVKPGTVRDVDTKDYKKLENQPALSDWTWAGKDTDGNPVFIKADLALHPELYDQLRKVLGKSKLREWFQNKKGNVMDIPKALAQGADFAISEAKRSMFGMIAPFHQVQEGWHGVGHRVNPVRVKEEGLVNRLAGGKVPESLVLPKIDLTGNAAQADAVRHGLMLAPDRNSSNQFMEGLGKTGLIGKIPILGKISNYYANYLFHEYIPGLKYLTYDKILGRNREVYAKDLASGKVSEAEVKALSATQANAAYGHLNYTDLGRSPTIQHFLQLGLLAPDFLEARARFTGQSIKGATGAKVGREQLIALGVLAAGQAALAYTVAKMVDGEWDPNHPFEMIKGNRKYTLRSVPEDLQRLFTDTRAFSQARLSLGTKAALQFGSGVDWRGQPVTPKETARELASQPIPLMLKPLLGGLPGVNKVFKVNSPLEAWEQLAGNAGLKISRYSHANETYKLAQDWKKNSGDPRLVAEYEQQQKTVNPDSLFKPLREALEKGSENDAKEAFAKLLTIKKQEDIDKAMRPFTVGKGISGMPERHYKPFTGNLKDEKKFKASLDADGLEMYKRARQEQTRRWEEYLAFKNRMKSQEPQE